MKDNGLLKRFVYDDITLKSYDCLRTYFNFLIYSYSFSLMKKEKIEINYVKINRLIRRIDNETK